MGGRVRACVRGGCPQECIRRSHGARVPRGTRALTAAGLVTGWLGACGTRRACATAAACRDLARRAWLAGAARAAAAASAHGDKLGAGRAAGAGGVGVGVVRASKACARLGRPCMRRAGRRQATRATMRGGGIRMQQTMMNLLARHSGCSCCARQRHSGAAFQLLELLFMHYSA